MLFVDPADHYAQRMAVHPSQRAIHTQPVSQRLHVATCISNPQRFYSRIKNYETFAKHIADSGALLYTVELAVRDRHHEIQQTTEAALIKLRSESILWHKERLLNVAISRFDPGWHYGAYIDADMIMQRPDWCVETIHQLQKFAWVQLFTTYADVQPDHTISPPQPSYMQVLLSGGTPPGYYGPYGKLWGGPGGGWAFRREAFDQCGGLLDVCIVGSGDYHMAVGLTLQPNRHPEQRIGMPAYLAWIDEWCKRAAVLKGNIGVVENFALHLWHGRRQARGYGWRKSILYDNSYDPLTDISNDWQGVLRWSGNKPKLEQDVMDYFASRDEDQDVLR